MDKEHIIQNLKDAGCNANLISDFFSLEKKEQLTILAKHRTKLLANLHENQKRIDCLDFLIFQLNQN